MGTQTVKRAIILAAAAATMLLAGCAAMGGKFQSDAFGANKTYAVVSVLSDNKVECGQPTGAVCNGGVLGLVNTLATANGAYSEDATATLEMVSPVVLQAFKTAPTLKVVPDVRTLAAYKGSKGDAQPPSILGHHVLVARGYKYFPEDQLARLANELKVDGVIVLTMHFTAMRSGLPVLGFGGGHVADTQVVITAVDNRGQVVWSDRARGSSEAGAGSVAGGVDFTKLRPFFMESTTNAMKRLIDKTRSGT